MVEAYQILRILCFFPSLILLSLAQKLNDLPTIRVVRGVVEEVNNPRCNFIDRTVRLAHSMGLQPGGNHFSSSSDVLKGIELMINNINTKRCGLKLENGDNVKIELMAFDDGGDPERVKSIIENTVKNTTYFPSPDYYLGPYSSGLTGVQSAITHEAGKLTIAGGSSATYVFKDRNLVFGTLTPSHKYLDSAIALLAKYGVKYIASFHEDVGFTKEACSSLSDLTKQHGIDLIHETVVPKDPSKDILDPIAKEYSAMKNEPDAVVSCLYETGCTSWMESMRSINWSPKAQVFTICVGQDVFEDAVGSVYSEFLLGVSPWDKSMSIVDTVSGWTASDFNQLFFEYASRPATYQAASGAASLGVLVQALEMAQDWTDTEEVASILRSKTFQTFYGIVSFDENGQSKVPFLALQYRMPRNNTHDELVLQEVFPNMTTDFIYPMPTWLERDCKSSPHCEGDLTRDLEGVGICSRDGMCVCNQLKSKEGRFAPSGFGASATCLFVPEENFNFIPQSTLILGMLLICLQVVMFIVAMCWMFKYRNKAIVKFSQPIFGIILSVGCLIQVMSIIPLSKQGEYRLQRDEKSFRLTQEPNQDIGSLDFACMANPWIYFIGVAVTFSALFAKILRVKIMYEKSLEMNRVSIDTKSTITIMVITLSCMVLPLLFWQLIAPFRWDRNTLIVDSNKYTLSSMGGCSPEYSWGWYLALPPFAVETIAYLYVLYLCYVTRDVPESLHDTKWIGISIACIVQSNILAIPLLVIATGSNPNVTYVVKAFLAFLQGFSVMVFIFVPKMWLVYNQQDEIREARVGTAQWRNELQRKSMISNMEIKTSKENYLHGKQVSQAQRDRKTLFSALQQENNKSSSLEALNEDKAECPS